MPSDTQSAEFVRVQRHTEVWTQGLTDHVAVHVELRLRRNQRASQHQGVEQPGCNMTQKERPESLHSLAARDPAQHKSEVAQAVLAFQERSLRIQQDPESVPFAGNDVASVVSWEDLPTA